MLLTPQPRRAPCLTPPPPTLLIDRLLHYCHIANITGNGLPHAGAPGDAALHAYVGSPTFDRQGAIASQGKTGDTRGSICRRVSQFSVGRNVQFSIGIDGRLPSTSTPGRITSICRAFGVKLVPHLGTVTGACLHATCMQCAGRQGRGLTPDAAARPVRYTCATALCGPPGRQTVCEPDSTEASRIREVRAPHPRAAAALQEIPGGPPRPVHRRPVVDSGSHPG